MPDLVKIHKTFTDMAHQILERRGSREDLQYQYKTDYASFILVLIETLNTLPLIDLIKEYKELSTNLKKINHISNVAPYLDAIHFLLIELEKN